MVRPRAGEGDLFGQAVAEELVVEELRAVVGVQTQQGERELLTELVLGGRVVTMDALLTQREIAQAIGAKGGTT